jgi:ribonuclease HI
MTAAKKPVVNQDLWMALDGQVLRHKTTWTWTKGHQPRRQQSLRRAGDESGKRADL